MFFNVSKRGLYFFGSIFISGAFIFLKPENLSYLHFVLSVAIIFVGLIPGILYLRQERKERFPFPFMALTGLFYAVFFGLPPLFIHHFFKTNDYRLRFYEYSFLNQFSFETQILILLGLIFMLLTWGTSRRFLFNKFPRISIVEPKDPRILEALAWVLATFSLLYGLVPELKLIPSIGQFLQPAGLLAFTIFYLMHKRKILTWGSKVIYFGIFLPIFICFLIATTFLTPIIFLFLLWITLTIAESNWLPWKSLLTGLALLIIVYPHLNALRGQLWNENKINSIIQYQSDPNTNNIFSVVFHFINIIVNHKRIGVLRDNKEYDFGPSQPPLTGLARRLSSIILMNYIVEVTPKKVAFWSGASYKTLFRGWIPRFLWKEKPKEHWGNKFGHRYHILYPSNHSMSLNLPWITEMYVNFGRIGVLFGMVLVGLFLGFLDYFLNSPKKRLVEQSIGFTVLLPLFYHESNFTLMTGSIFPLILSFWLYFSFGFWLYTLWCKSQG